MRWGFFRILETPANSLRAAIEAERLSEDIARRVVHYDRAGWPTCPGCGQSCTSSYDGHRACTRCQLALPVSSDPRGS